MELVKNAVGRMIPDEIDGRKLKPFAGAFATQGGGRKQAPPIPVSLPGQQKLLKSVKEAIQMTGLKSGMTISFHHHLRNGDFVINMVLDLCAEMGIKDLTLAATALFPIHKPVIDHIKSGVVSNIEGSMNGAIGDFVSHGGMNRVAILRSHGGRVRAIQDGDLHIDVAFIAAPCADSFGNANGVSGPSVCGPLSYSLIDSEYADKVVVITDNLVDFPCFPMSIQSTNVDYVVEVDKIGDPAGIMTGTMRITESPTRLTIAQMAADFIHESPYFKEGMSFQTGAGGISLAITKYLGEYMEKEKVHASFINGGITSFIIDLYKKGITNKLFDGQIFDINAIESFRDDINHVEIPMSMYANIHSKGCVVNLQDVGFLGATEIDTNYNINVNTHSDGLLLHGIGGHQDVAAGAKLTMIVVPSYRKRIPIICDEVTNVTTPGETVDVVVTERGIAINPLRNDLLDYYKKSKLPIKTIEEIRDEVFAICDKPQKPKFKDRIVALIEYRDGTIIDTVRQIDE